MMIELRDLLESDVDDMMQWATDPEVTRFLTWDAYTSRDALVDFYKTFVARHPFFKAISWDGRVIGSLTLTPGDGIYSCRAELGYVMARKYWGQGIMTAAVKLGVELGFQQLHIARIDAAVFKENIASQRVLIKAGFANTGLQHSYALVKGKLRDCYMFEMVREASDGMGSSRKAIL